MSSRLILLDYDGTVMRQGLVNKMPSKEVISILNSLSNDPKNVVFIVSGRGMDTLGRWFDWCKKLDLSAEHSYFTRWNVDSVWESCGLTVDLGWKKMTVPMMKHYTKATGVLLLCKKKAMWYGIIKKRTLTSGHARLKSCLIILRACLLMNP